MKKIPKRIGIMGGTFDPIHYGHLLIAQSAAEELQLDKVLFIPTGKSPHKNVKDVTEPVMRCEMVSLAISDNQKFYMSDLEVNSTHTNYTYQTLQKLKLQYPDSHLFFIMGEDSLAYFDQWKEPKRICELASLLVAVRDDTTGVELQKLIDHMAERMSADIIMLHSPNFSVSSRNIRDRVSQGKSIRYMVPPSIDTFIHRNHLYCDTKEI